MLLGARYIKNIRLCLLISISKSFGDCPIELYIFRFPFLAEKKHIKILSVVSKTEIKLQTNMNKHLENCNNVQNLSLTFLWKVEIIYIKTHSKFTL